MKISPSYNMEYSTQLTICMPTLTQCLKCIPAVLTLKTEQKLNQIKKFNFKFTSSRRRDQDSSESLCALESPDSKYIPTTELNAES